MFGNVDVKDGVVTGKLWKIDAEDSATCGSLTGSIMHYLKELCGVLIAALASIAEANNSAEAKYSSTCLLGSRGAQGGQHTAV